MKRSRLTYVTFRGRVLPVPAGGSDDAPPPDPDEGTPPEGYVSQDEYEKVKQRMSNADRRAGELQKLLEQREQQPTANPSEVNRLKRQNAILRANADRDDPFVSLDAVEPFVPDDTDPDDMADALEAVADRHPYLLRRHAVGAMPAPDALVQPPGPHQTPSRQDKNAGSGAISAAALERRYPALRRNTRHLP